MSKNIKIDLTGTCEEVMNVINETPITDEFKTHLWKEYKKDYDGVWNRTKDNIPKNYIGEDIPINELVPKGMTIKEYFGKEQRLLRGENISYMKFD